LWGLAVNDIIIRDVTDKIQQVAVCRHNEILPEAGKSEDRNPWLVKMYNTILCH